MLYVKIIKQDGYGCCIGEIEEKCKSIHPIAPRLPAISEVVDRAKVHRSDSRNKHVCVCKIHGKHSDGWMLGYEGSGRKLS